MNDPWYLRGMWLPRNAILRSPDSASADASRSIDETLANIIRL
jgi:hypothetical protein